MFGTLQWPWSTSSRIPTPRSSTTASAKFHAHLEADDIDKLYKELRRARRLDLRYTAPPGYHVEEAESRKTWSYTLSRLIIGKLEEYQLRKALAAIGSVSSAEEFLHIQDALSTTLMVGPDIDLVDYAGSNIALELPAVRDEADEFRERIRIGLPRMMTHGSLDYNPPIRECQDLRSACAIEYRKTRSESFAQIVSHIRIAHALDGTLYGLSLHGNQWFRPFQYTGQDEITTWILRGDERYFYNHGLVSTDGVFEIPIETAYKVFRESPFGMFAFRLTANHAHVAQAKVLIRFMARLCCDLFELREQQARHDHADIPVDTFVWPDNGPFEVDPTLAARVVITGVTIEAVTPFVERRNAREAGRNAYVDGRAGQECSNSKKRKAPSTSKTWDSTGHAQRRNRGWKGYGPEGYEGTVYSDDTSIDTPADSDSEMSWRTIESIRDMPVVPLSIRGWRQQVGAFEQEDPATADDEQLDPDDEERSDVE